MSCPRCKNDEASIHYSGEIGNLIRDFMDSPLSLLRIDEEGGMPGVEIVRCFSCEQNWLVSYRYWDHPPLLLNALAIKREFVGKIEGLSPDVLLGMRNRGMLMAEFMDA